MNESIHNIIDSSEGWRHQVEEIPGFINNLKSRDNLPEGVDTMIAELEKDLAKYNVLMNRATRQELIDEAKKNLIDKSIEISKLIPRLKIKL